MTLSFLAACGGSTTSTNAVSISEINTTFSSVIDLFGDGSSIEDEILSAGEIAALGSANYAGIAGIGTGPDDEGGLLGRLSMQVTFGAEPVVSGTADGFVAVSRDDLNASPGQFLADNTALESTSGSLTFSNGSIVTQSGISALAFDVDGEVDVPSQAGLALGTGVLTINGNTAAVVTDHALISDFSEVSGSIGGEDVPVGFSIYGFRE